jgi:hypothetical protein
VCLMQVFVTSFVPLKVHELSGVPLCEVQWSAGTLFERQYGGFNTNYRQFVWDES